MSDRELLELAAKAAGIKVDWRESVECLCYSGSPYNVAWSPHKDYGDSMHLAATLRISITFIGRGTVQTWADGTTITTEVIHKRADPAAATRRAVLQTAAEIGRAMP